MLKQYNEELKTAATFRGVIIPATCYDRLSEDRCLSEKNNANERFRYGIAIPDIAKQEGKKT